MPFVRLGGLLALFILWRLTAYAVRDRQHVWGLLPTKWLVLSSAAGMLFISFLANRGIEMSSLPVSVLVSEFMAATLFFLVLNFIKVPMFRRLRIA